MPSAIDSATHKDVTRLHLRTFFHGRRTFLRCLYDNTFQKNTSSLFSHLKERKPCCYFFVWREHDTFMLDLQGSSRVSLVPAKAITVEFEPPGIFSCQVVQVCFCWNRLWFEPCPSLVFFGVKIHRCQCPGWKNCRQMKGQLQILLQLINVAWNCYFQRNRKRTKWLLRHRQRKQDPSQSTAKTANVDDLMFPSIRNERERDWMRNTLQTQEHICETPHPAEACVQIHTYGFISIFVSFVQSLLGTFIRLLFHNGTVIASFMHHKPAKQHFQLHNTISRSNIIARASVFWHGDSICWTSNRSHERNMKIVSCSGKGHISYCSPK